MRLEARGFDKKKHKRLPIFLGYTTPDNTTHWEVTLIDIDDFFENKQSIEQQYHKIKDSKVDWAITHNCSYQYFFGRGAFSSQLTPKKILIIGTGAIGSQVARTLTKSGCRNLTLADYDQKYPENVCRSEFRFNTGLTDKISELASILQEISPFVDVYSISDFLTEYGLKSAMSHSEYKQKFKEAFDSFDYIFDCSTDDDLMFLLDSLNLDVKIFNLSISNHAKALVCGVSPNCYRAVRHQFDNIIENDIENLYNPTGCWSPTFKASYNDIATLVQFALKHINTQVDNNLPMHNFIIEYDETEMNLGIKQF